LPIPEGVQQTSKVSNPELWAASSQVDAFDAESSASGQAYAGTNG